MKGVTNINALKDILYNLHPQSGATSDYARGILVATVGTLMATKGLTWNQAMAMCSDWAPKYIIVDSIPVTWYRDFDIIKQVNTNPTFGPHLERSKGV